VLADPNLTLADRDVMRSPCTTAGDVRRVPTHTAPGRQPTFPRCDGSAGHTSVGEREIRVGKHDAPILTGVPAVESLGDPPVQPGTVPQPQPARDADPADPPILGVYCKKAHFNDPNVAYCSACGISMAQGNRTPELGSRPQLGTFGADDGTTFPLLRGPRRRTGAGGRRGGGRRPGEPAATG